ncbi:winged helix-turn-helix domain-containing protein, partial [Streptomyces spongiae]|uniref:winged helix-turn-helix domain-containing protein n=1 Tax=Streptomyces spongiae TaxID=565072 RepID=UPI001D15A63E
RQFESARGFEAGPVDSTRSFDATGSYDSTSTYDSTSSYNPANSPNSPNPINSPNPTGSFDTTGSFGPPRSFEAPDPSFDAAPPPEAAPEEAAGPLVVDRRTRQVWVGNSPIALTPKEFELLALLTEDPGAVYSRQQILDRVWDPHYEGPTKTLDVHVATLRRKLGNPAWIQTLRGVGFRLAVHMRPPTPYPAPGPQAAYR